MRAVSESLPLITEFVVDRVDRSFQATFADGAVAEQGIEFSNSTEIPSIEEFVARAPYVERSREATPVAEPEAQPFVQLQHHAAVEVPAVPEVAPPMPSQVEPAVAVAPEPEPESSSVAATVEPIKPLEPPAEPASIPGRDWIAEERDAFDWQSIATLAGPDDERRATEDWTSTDWDDSSNSVSASASENVAGVLMQVARRVRAGELKVDLQRGMTTEAALAAVLTALLSEPDTDGGVRGPA